MKSKTGGFIRKSLLINSKTLRQARKVLNADTDAEAIRLSVEWVAETNRFQKFMETTRGTLKPGSFETAS
jgi:hypothetical protein